MSNEHARPDPEPRTSSPAPTDEQVRDALAVLAIGFGTGGCEGWAADIAVYALGWCARCGRPDGLTPFHNAMNDPRRFQNAHDFVPMEKPYD